MLRVLPHEPGERVRLPLMARRHVGVDRKRHHRRGVATALAITEGLQAVMDIRLRSFKPAWLA